ncbi:MAG: GGDEF domain-containing protein [Pseudomonadota bacterium]
MMKHLRKWMGEFDTPQGVAPDTDVSRIATQDDDCLDTISGILRIFGEFEIPLEDPDPRFADLCKSYARHVTHGAAIEDEGIHATGDGSRQWARVRHFFEQRRRNESEFVQERIRNYRIVVEDITNGLRSIGASEDSTSSAVMTSLASLEQAAETEDMSQIRRAVKSTLAEVEQAFTAQTANFEAQIAQAQRQMQTIKSDLLVPTPSPERDRVTDTCIRTDFEAAIQHLVSMSFVLRQPAVIGLLRIDNIAQINSDYGNGAGDDVLRGVADCLVRSFVRRSDIIARFSGDTFGVLLGDVGITKAAAVFERTVSAIPETVSIPYAGVKDAVACRAGLSAIQFTDTADSALERVRGALRRAADGTVQVS